MIDNSQNESNDKKESKLKPLFLKAKQGFIGFFKSLPSRIRKGFKSFVAFLKSVWAFLKKAWASIKKFYGRVNNFCKKVSTSTKSLLIKLKELLMKLSKKLLPLIIVLCIGFLFVTGFVGVEAPNRAGPYTRYNAITGEVMDEVPEAEFVVSEEAMIIILAVALSILVQLYKVNQVKNGKQQPGAEKINMMLWIAGSLLVWWGENIGLDLKGLAQEFPQFDIELTLKGLAESLGDAVVPGSAIVGAANVAYYLLKRSLYKLDFLKSK